MRKLLNNPWIVGALTITAVLFVLYSLRFQLGLSHHDYFAAPDQAAALSSEQNSPETPAPEQESTTATLSSEEITARLGSLDLEPPTRDPFRFPKPAGNVVVTSTQPAGETLSFTVSAIWRQTGADLLVLNGRICRQGDTVDLANIQDITDDGAWIVVDGLRHFIAVGQTINLTAKKAELTSKAL